MTETATIESAFPSQVLTFSVDGEEYGIDILRVQEIKGYSPTTRIPNSPPDVVGVLNLRGTIVPIVDLRRKFGLAAGSYDSFSGIVVCGVGGRTLGMIVDRVSEVVSLDATAIEGSTDNLGDGRSAYLQGLATLEGRLVILLDVDAVFGSGLGTGDFAA